MLFKGSLADSLAHPGIRIGCLAVQRTESPFTTTATPFGRSWHVNTGQRRSN